MATHDEIEKILKSIKLRRNLWSLSNRPQNSNTLSILGMDDQALFDIICNELNWRDYSKGPELDDHHPPIPGDIWIFGLIISGQQYYLKFQDRPDRIVVWISIHQADYPVELPYR